VLTFYNEHHAQHQGRADTRVARVLAEFERRGLGQVVTPHGVPLVSLERIHTPRYLHFLRTVWSEWVGFDGANARQEVVPALFAGRGARADLEPDDFAGRLGLYATDTASPITAGTWIAAKTGADCAVNAAHALRLGQRGTFALSLPPGRHAGADFFGGACFLNNAALAAQHLLDDGAQRVAILDIGCHHGTGTQSIFYGRSDVLTLSIHADPRSAYPFYAGHADETGLGAGRGFNMNVPLARGASNADWFLALETACVKLAGCAPQALVVSLGVDGCGADPLSPFALQSGDYLRIGERIGHTGLPTVFVFEGGSALADIGIHAVNVLEGFETAA
jgi:acetoin utilization deacetylase AcuC-like enzyme